MGDSSGRTLRSIDFTEIVKLLDFCPFEWASDLLLIGGQTRVSVVSVLYSGKTPNIEGSENVLEVNPVRDFHHGCRVTALAWSPATSLNVVPKVLRFCTAGSDRAIRFYSSDLKNEDLLRIIDGHKDYVNGLAFDPVSGETIASVSDDHTCRLFELNGTEKASFQLQSPGIAVNWQADEPDKLMVAEKGGTIRFYNVAALQPLMILDCGGPPLTSADWNPNCLSQVAAIVGDSIQIFDTASTSRPVETKQVHSDGGTHFRWARHSSGMAASIGRPGRAMKVYNLQMKQTISALSETILNGLTWHYSLPLIAVGGDRKVIFWSADS